jgi:predicted ferric reductase
VAYLLFLGYLAAILSPLIVLSLSSPQTHHGVIYDTGRHFALIVAAILIMQVVLAARLRIVDRYFGLNNIFPFHRNMAVLAGSLLLLHPFLLAWGGQKWNLVTSLDLPWYIWVGRLTFFILLANVFMAVSRDKVGVKFETWRLGHDISGLFILAGAFVHSWYAGGDLAASLPLRLWWLALFALAVGLFAYHRLVRPLLLKRHPYRVIEVKLEADGVWTLKFAPPEGGRRFDFLPGQWQFVTLLRGRGLPEEEHHFTISSSPAQENYHTSTIKELGDFTGTIGQGKPGDLAVIHAPFGIFSHTRRPEVRDLVYIAGGIGITPFMSNLRHMRDARADKRVLLLYANRRETDIVFRAELSEIEAGPYPELAVVHALSRPADDWPGERGHLDQDKLRRLCGRDRLERATFYLAGPPGMLEAVIKALRDLKIPDSRISVEYFTF